MQKAVSIVVVQGRKAYLGTRLNLTDNYGKRCFPGGKVEDGESCRESACRELHQETHGFAVRLPPKAKLMNLEPAKNRGWKAVPLLHILKISDEKLLPGTKYFVHAAASKFGLIAATPPAPRNASN